MIFYENFGKILNEATTQKFTIPHGSELTIYVSMCANGIMGFDVQEFPLDNFNKLDLRSEQLPLNLDTNKVGLGIYVNLPNKYEEYKVYGFTDYLSDLGGFYSFIEGIFSFIFGSGKLEPWGKAQILFLIL
ncbi:hypothetical protein GLOIN_2v1867293 [Rhizophagus irregularis DAOM 181602=DAOM 197198]|nr:hypothetical protein GLOIN_2v1867293 [Rhizophagus irregularis DAOM 181602=DAOM 197198]